MAVYTHVTDADLTRFLTQYDVGEPRAFKGIAEGVENSNYFVQTDRDKYILTLFEKRVNENDLPFFMGLMQALVDKGLPTAAPIRDKKDQVIQTLCGRPAVLIQFVEGVSLDNPNKGNCAELGTFLAKMHLAVEDIPLSRPNSMNPEGWAKLIADITPDAARLKEDAGPLATDEFAFLKAHWPTENELPRGVVHADLFPDNVLLTNNKITGVIDFYFACTDFFVYDLAICLTSWCFDKEHIFDKEYAKAMLETYEKARPLNNAEKQVLPLLLRGAALRFLLTRAYDWLNQVDGALVRVKDPLEYAAKLRYYQTLKNFEDITHD